MITGWLVKLIIIIAILGFAVIEIGSPIVTRVQLDDALHQSADDAAQTYFQTHNADQAKATAQNDADNKSFTLLGFSVDDQGVTHVKGSKQAKSLLLHRISQTKSWYDVTETVSGHYNTK